MSFVLTLDDGPSAAARRKLAFLESRGIKAIWFCVGLNLQRRPRLTADIIRAGHIVANHSYHHPHFSAIDLPTAITEITTTDHLIEGAYEQAGLPRSARLFRFPYGDQGDGETAKQQSQRPHRTNIAAVLNDLHYEEPPHDSVEFYDNFLNVPGDRDWLWSYDAKEWAIGDEDTYHLTYDNIVTNLRRYVTSCDRNQPHVVLFHDHAPTTPHFTELVDIMISEGAEFELP
jgi:peptidoglycan/xylan/chitin deacetylase (PgdA/CDA1 family)